MVSCARATAGEPPPASHPPNTPTAAPRPAAPRGGGSALPAAQSDVASVEVAVPQRLRHAVTDRFQPVPMRGDIVETSHEPFEEAEVVQRQNGIVEGIARRCPHAV